MSINVQPSFKAFLKFVSINFIVKRWFNKLFQSFISFFVLLVFTVTPFKLDPNKNQNHSPDKVQNLGNEQR